MENSHYTFDDIVGQMREKMNQMTGARIAEFCNTHFDMDIEPIGDSNKYFRHVPHIKAECHSDDRIIEVDFLADAWFDDATTDEILALARCGWGGVYPADNVVHVAAEYDESVHKMFQYLELVANKKDAPGFECHVDPESAKEWLRIRGYDMILQKIEKIENCEE